MVPFNKPYLSGKEAHYLYDAVESGKISGNGVFTKKCHSYFKDHYNFQFCLLTTSCTDALEMASILINIKEGDEVIVPSFTFVSSANAFVLKGAKIVFADSYADNPNIDPSGLEELITEKTVAIVVVHYAGIACDMDEIQKITSKHGLFLIEDAAQAIDSYYKNRPLGSIGDFGAFSFHETKNIISGEGGLLTINNPAYNKRAEIIWEKGTNRAEFFRGESDKYEWVDIGSSFLPSEITAAFLYAQLESIKKIQEKRLSHWKRYYENLSVLENKGACLLPKIPPFASNNAHMFFLVTSSKKERNQLIEQLQKHDIQAVSHYLPLHQSPYYNQLHDGRKLPNSETFAQGLLRLPMYYQLQSSQIDEVTEVIINFFMK